MAAMLDDRNNTISHWEMRSIFVQKSFTVSVIQHAALQTLHCPWTQNIKTKLPIRHLQDGPGHVTYSPGVGGTPQHFGWGCAARFSKP